MPATKASPPEPLHTPDGRYIIVRGRLWRAANPHLAEHTREQLVADLMSARRDKQRAMRAGDTAAREAAKHRVNQAKIHLGERGPVWWRDGTPDLNRHLVRNSPYADWFATQQQGKLGPQGEEKR